MSNTKHSRTFKLTGAQHKAAVQLKNLHDSFAVKMAELEKEYQDSVDHLQGTLGATINQRFVDLFESVGLPATEVKRYYLDATYYEAHGDIFLNYREPETFGEGGLSDIIEARMSVKH